jgi:hypothetical protein
MKHHRLSNRWVTWVAVGAVLVALTIAPAIAFGQTGVVGTGTGSDQTVPVSGPAITAETGAAAVTYWTPERMNAAVPLDIVVDKSGVKTLAERPAAPDGPAVNVAGNAPGVAVAQDAEEVRGTAPAVPAAPVASWYSYPFPFDYSSVEPSWLYIQYPWRTNGKLFFSQNDSGGVRRDYVCSGTSTTSGAGGNRRLVWTAGHCVNSGVGSRWSYNVQFCPAWFYGMAPYGCWTALELWSLTGWVGAGNLRYDQGVIITSNTSSAGYGRLGDTVGTQGLAWNQPRSGHSPYDFWFSFGYPAAAPFNGQTMNWCSASIAVGDAPNALAGPATTGIGCNMTGGSSGGGWIMWFRMGSFGYVNSVNSYKYINPAQPNAMYGPYFDTGTGNLYNTTRVRFP